MKDCLFCRIVAGTLPSDVVYETDQVLAFRDIRPAAPVHVLIVPKQHMANVLELADHPQVMAALLEAVAHVAGLLGVDQSGFRLINNCGVDGGQTVMHVHFHLLGGQPLGEQLL